MGDGDKTPLRSSSTPKSVWSFTVPPSLPTPDSCPFESWMMPWALLVASDYLQESRTGRNIRHHLVPLLQASPSTAAWPATMTPTMQNVFPKTQP